MAWFWFSIAFVIANVAAVVFYFALRLGWLWRRVAWLVCSAVIALSPCAVPREARALRFVECVAAICLLFKLFDAYRAPALARGMGLGRWIAYLPNWFWFVLRRVPRPTEDQIKRSLEGVLCRCTGYLGIVEGISWAVEHTTPPAEE